MRGWNFAIFYNLDGARFVILSGFNQRKNSKKDDFIYVVKQENAKKYNVTNSLTLTTEWRLLNILEEESPVGERKGWAEVILKTVGEDLWHFGDGEDIVTLLNKCINVNTL